MQLASNIPEFVSPFLNESVCSALAKKKKKKKTYLYAFVITSSHFRKRLSQHTILRGEFRCTFCAIQVALEFGIKIFQLYLMREVIPLASKFVVIPLFLASNRF
jgi:hypothetical protein